MIHKKSMRNGTITNRLLSTAGLAAILVGGAAATPLLQEGSTPPPAPTPSPAPQEKEKPVEPPKKEDKGLRELDPLGGSGPTGAGEEEMKELFIKVDKRLKRVSELLFEASTGDSSRSSEIGAAGIDELIREAENASGAGASGIGQILEASRSQSEAARTEIDRILEIAAQQGSPGSGGQGGPPPPTPSEGMPKQGQTPGGSQKEEKGQSPEEQGKGKQGEQQQQDQQPGGEEPRGGQEQKGGPDGPGKPQPKSETGDPSNATGNEEWGDLPVHLRKTFQNGVSDDVPPRYRDWVDSYYKRLNRRSGK